MLALSLIGLSNRMLSTEAGPRRCTCVLTPVHQLTVKVKGKSLLEKIRVTVTSRGWYGLDGPREPPVSESILQLDLGVAAQTWQAVFYKHGCISSSHFTGLLQYGPETPPTQ